jgi:HTH-type transcriptional repressor of NAD biosynthesis genes
MKKYKNSLVLGKFYGLHTGHLYLIDTALENSEVVHVLACHNPTQTIPGKLRVKTLRKIYEKNKNVIIHSVDDGEMPQYESECKSLDEFYGYWVPFVYGFVGNLDCVFTSENYGEDFAKYLDIEHFLVDRERIKHPVSGTKIRTNPFDNWEFIPEEIRPHFIKRIAIMGPESVGKSTLTKNLARYYNTNFVEEYGRTVFERNGNKIGIEDFIPISVGRQDIEDQRLKTSNKLLFCDTEDITTYLFSKMFFPNDYQSIENILLNKIYKNNNYDLYLLLGADCDGVQDGTRQFLEERIDHYDVIKSELDKHDCNYIEINGNWEERIVKSIEIINHQFNIDSP